ncbi:hypothetical protein E2C01_013706 [Portunus trituberculatus]|uniref:Uncharacterized protein n=1 Tax=Portunus trituberculatus TaxID=210409 RepID=A0A5B7DI72_PORTR|nr:hypothetical protein [Portunus trituberculatus]
MSIDSFWSGMQGRKTSSVESPRRIILSLRLTCKASEQFLNRHDEQGEDFLTSSLKKRNRKKVLNHFSFPLMSPDMLLMMSENEDDKEKKKRRNQ